VSSVGRPLGQKPLRELRGRLEKRVRGAHLVVALLGAGGRGLYARRAVARALRRLRIIALIPEDDFPRNIGPSIAEEIVFSDDDTDLVFLYIESWGSATEFGQFRLDPRVAPKLRILVPSAFHPIHGSRRSYLTDAYLTHLAVHGHVYAVGDSHRLRVPTPGSLIITLAERYRQTRALAEG